MTAKELYSKLLLEFSDKRYPLVLGVGLYTPSKSTADGGRCSFRPITRVVFHDDKTRRPVVELMSEEFRREYMPDDVPLDSAKLLAQMTAKLDWPGFDDAEIASAKDRGNAWSGHHVTLVESVKPVRMFKGEAMRFELSSRRDAERYIR